MKQIAVIIKHPFWNNNDYRIDIYTIPEEMSDEELEDYVMEQMLGSFEILAMTEKISFDCKTK